jgi:UDPglucose 6-dehydrogenase
MKVCVFGFWHRGSVTAACLASRAISTVGLAESIEAATALNAGTAPLFEPGLDSLIQQGLQSGALNFTQDVAAAVVATTDLTWITGQNG